MQIHELTALARQMKASDIHLSEGLPLMFRVDGRLMQPPVQMSADETRSLILGLMDEAHREAILTERIDADFALVAPDGTRSRVNVFFQQRSDPCHRPHRQRQVHHAGRDDRPYQ